MRHFNMGRRIILFNTQITQVHFEGEVFEPIQPRLEYVLEYLVVVPFPRITVTKVFDNLKVTSGLVFVADDHRLQRMPFIT